MQRAFGPRAAIVPPAVRASGEGSAQVTSPGVSPDQTEGRPAPSALSRCRFCASTSGSSPEWRIQQPFSVNTGALNVAP